MQTFWSFTLGNLFTALGGLMTLALLWWRFAQDSQKTQDQLAVLNSRLLKSEGEMDQMTRMGLLTTLAQHERRLGECERAISDISEMKTDIRWIKKDLEGNKQ